MTDGSTLRYTGSEDGEPIDTYFEHTNEGLGPVLLGRPDLRPARSRVRGWTPDRGHVRLLRPGHRRQRLVLRRGLDGVRVRRRRQPHRHRHERQLARGRQRCAARLHHAGRSRDGFQLLPGVRAGRRSRRPGDDLCAARVADHRQRHLRERAAGARDDRARTRRVRIQVLRAGCRPDPGRGRSRREPGEPGHRVYAAAAIRTRTDDARHAAARHCDAGCGPAAATQAACAETRCSARRREPSPVAGMAAAHAPVHDVWHSPRLASGGIQP